MRLVLSILLSLALALPASAASYYVALGGSNAAVGDITHPWATIAYAMTRATAAGDTVYVRAGTYHESITFAASGTSGSPVTVRNYASEKIGRAHV